MKGARTKKTELRKSVLFERRGPGRKHRGQVFGDAGLCYWGLVGKERQNYIEENIGEHGKGNVSISPGAGPHFRCYESMVKSSGRSHMRTGEILLYVAITTEKNP